MAEETFNLNREQNREALVDALGKQWKIHSSRQTGLCYARPNPDRDDARIPESFQGQWTKASLLRPKILDYVDMTWDKADKADQAAERKRQVALEHKTKVKNDKRSATK